MKGIWYRYLAAVMLVGCVAVNRDCASCMAENWVVVQLDLFGNPFRCWELQNVGIVNEDKSDGIFWQDTNNLVHISGAYNRVQVVNRHWDEAFQALGLTQARCREIRQTVRDVNPPPASPQQPESRPSYADHQ